MFCLSEGDQNRRGHCHCLWLTLPHLTADNSVQTHTHTHTHRRVITDALGDTYPFLLLLISFFADADLSIKHSHISFFHSFFPFILLRATTVFSCVVQNLMYTQFVARGDSSSSSSSSSSAPLLGIFPLDCSLL